MATFFNLLSTSASTVYHYAGQALEYNGYLWLIGGSPNSFGDAFSDRVIRSADGGYTWETVTNVANLNKSFLHTTIVYDGYMWLIGGQNYLGTPNNDVRRSTNGINWTYLTWPSGSKCRGTAACVHKGRLYLSGGFHGSYSNGVYSTTDGSTWTTHQVDGATGTFAATAYHIMYSFNDTLFIGTTSNELWYSIDDGNTWNLYSSSTFTSGVPYVGSVVAFGYVYTINSTGTQLYYSSNGYDFSNDVTSGGTNWGNSRPSTVLSSFNGRLVLIGSGTSSNSGYSFGSSQYPYYDSDIRFNLNNIHSPSPAYIRLTDDSTVYDVSGGALTDYTRVWKLTNDSTSASIFYESNNSYIDITVEGIYGDTISVSLSAVF